MSRLALMLRAVNVGGTGKLAMADFRQALEGLGLAEARTLGAAGSAVAMTDADPVTVEARLEAVLADRFGLATDVLARAHAELTEVLAGNPFARMAEVNPSGLVVLFLRGAPAAADLAALRDRIQGPEEIEAGPRSLYIAYGAGMGTSKLTGGLIERTLGLRGTGRNWNTVRKLAELTAP